MTEQLENKFFGEELIVRKGRNPSIKETICRVKVPSMITFVQSSIIIKKVYGYCGGGEWREDELGRYTRKDSNYKELNLKLSRAGL
jgi:hypothetical protein